MQIITIYSSENAVKAKGLTVVIDVFRAFSTACYVINNGAQKIITVADISLAYKLKKENPEYILMGEREGVKQPGFDYGNSPFEIKNVDFQNKIIIQTTTRGTQAINNTVKAEEIITGSFVNAQAVINYIEGENPKRLSLVCSSNKTKNNEDIMFAQYIKSQLKNKPLDFQKIKSNLQEYKNLFPKGDFESCLDLNRFNFILKAERKNNFISLKKILTRQ